MEVYCQNTETNLRICSLLSSVLGRRHDPTSNAALFNKAIINKQQLLVDTNSKSGSKRQVHGVVQIILVGFHRYCQDNETSSDSGCNDLEFLSYWIPRFALRYDLKVLHINIFACHNDDDDDDDDGSHHRPLSELMNQCNHNVVLVGVDQAGTEYVYKYLLTQHSDHQKILGVISIHPTTLPYFWTVPLFVILQNSSSLLGHHGGGKEIRKCVTNPRLIGVVTPYQKRGIADTTTIVAPTDIRCNYTAALWLVRLIAKYAEASQIVYRTHHSYPSPQQKDQSATIFSRL